jgi:hypothetical protein
MSRNGLPNTLERNVTDLFDIGPDHPDWEDYVAWCDEGVRRGLVPAPPADVDEFENVAETEQ